MALRAGWLRGRKMDTAMERGRSHGLTKLEDEVYKRLLVPRWKHHVKKKYRVKALLLSKQKGDL